MTLMKKVNVLVLGLAVLAAVSCGKDSDKETPEPAAQVQAACMLTRHVFPRNGIPESSQEFMYDNAGKLVQVNFRMADSPVIRFLDEITYNAAGQVAAIKITGPNTTESRRVFSYNSSNQPDTITNFNGAQKSGFTTYEYNSAGQLIKWSVFTVHDSLALHYADITYPAANQSREKHYARQASGGYMLDKSSEYTFDDKWHPYSRLGYYSEQLLFSQHNVLSTAVTYAAQSYTTRRSYAYEYNAAGYPVKKTETNDQGQTVDYFTYNCQ